MVDFSLSWGFAFCANPFILDKIQARLCLHHWQHDRKGASFSFFTSDIQISALIC